jgi:hypothetical protein
MRNYEIVLIEEEVAHMYHGMEKKLFHLFKENNCSQGVLKAITTNQIEYITKPYSRENLDQYIHQFFFHNKAYSYSEYEHTLYDRRENSYAKLEMHPEKMILTAEGAIDAETRFFEILRSYHSYFLAINYEENKYGWLKPIRVVNFMQDK